MCVGGGFHNCSTTGWSDMSKHVSWSSEGCGILQLFVKEPQLPILGNPLQLLSVYLVCVTSRRQVFLAPLISSARQDLSSHTGDWRSDGLIKQYLSSFQNMCLYLYIT